eukprot:SAG22_NODE_2123_length_2975_cov_22.253477_1_plen_233_part_00
MPPAWLPGCLPRTMVGCDRPGHLRVGAGNPPLRLRVRREVEHVAAVRDKWAAAGEDPARRPHRRAARRAPRHALPGGARVVDRPGAGAPLALGGGGGGRARDPHRAEVRLAVRRRARDHRVLRVPLARPRRATAAAGDRVVFGARRQRGVGRGGRRPVELERPRHRNSQRAVAGGLRGRRREQDEGGGGGGGRARGRAAGARLRLRAQRRHAVVLPGRRPVDSVTTSGEDGD